MLHHVRAGIFIVGIVAALSGAEAQTVDEKLCILSAAQKLPIIQGLTISSSTAKRVEPSEAAKSVIKTSDPLERTANNLDAVFNFMTDRLLQKVKYQYSEGGPDAVRVAIQEALSKSLSGGAKVDISIKAAGQEATLSYACALGTLGGVYTTSIGIAR